MPVRLGAHITPRTLPSTGTGCERKGDTQQELKKKKNKRESCKENKNKHHRGLQEHEI